MHRLSIVDAWILLAIYHAGKSDGTGYAAIISSLPSIDRPIPAHDEFMAAYNKFLYLSFIVADGDKTSLSLAAKQLIEATRLSGTTEDAQAWVDSIYKILSTYKLKSMCNRYEWKEDQYLRGIELLAKTTRK